MAELLQTKLPDIPDDPRNAMKVVTDIIFKNLYPKMLRIRDMLKGNSGSPINEETLKIQDVYVLCSSQIKKCLQTLFYIFKREYLEDILMQETRRCTMERLSWCYSRLLTIENHLQSEQNPNTSTESMFSTPMYFVNWIDHTFETLNKLAEIIYKTDYKDTVELHNQWKNDMVECVGTLHVSLDELLLSAMTLCKYCLPADQRVVKARCQVVLRDAKTLLSELIDGDLDNGFKATVESLKLPIMPSNVNVLIDVLKDVLYVLETNTNTALLALLVHCFSYSVSPVDVLKRHMMSNENCLSCSSNEDCQFVKDFDLYNERLLQIGSFAVSCSSDQNRVLTLRSGLASLEALDPQLVPALQLQPTSAHAHWIATEWRQAVREVRDSVFLIVDPAAFAEKSMQMMHPRLLELTRNPHYDNSTVCDVINMGAVIHDFFDVYDRTEPDALAHRDALVPLLADLDKVQTECKIVNNLLCSETDFKYEVTNARNKTVTVEQLVKRLKLLYTLVNKINTLLRPKENEELFECEEVPIRNVTHTIKNHVTYVNSPKKPMNASRSIFARTNVRSASKFPLGKLTKHLKAKMNDELSFSVQLDELFNLSDAKSTKTANKHLDCIEKPSLFNSSEAKPSKIVNKHLDSMREPSVLYNFSPKKRNSLRKAVLSRHCQLLEIEKGNHVENSVCSDKGSLMDEATSLQVTDILNQMSDMTITFSTTRPTKPINVTRDSRHQNEVTRNDSNILRINVNDVNTFSKHIWSIPVNASAVELPLDDTGTTAESNLSQPSDVTTLERIHDIDLLESRLSDLKSIEETSL